MSLYMYIIVIYKYTMKKYVIILALVLVTLVSNAQSRRPTYSNETKQTTGIALTVGGLGFSLAGFLTVPITTGQYVSNGNNVSMSVKNTQAPFYQQGPRFGCIVTGVTVSVTGLISLIANK